MKAKKKRDSEPTFSELFKVIVTLQIFKSALGFWACPVQSNLKLMEYLKFLRALQFVSDQSSGMQRIKQFKITGSAFQNVYRKSGVSGTMFPGCQQFHCVLPATEFYDNQLIKKKSPGWSWAQEKHQFLNSQWVPLGYKSYIEGFFPLGGKDSYIKLGKASRSKLKSALQQKYSRKCIFSF